MQPYSGHVLWWSANYDGLILLPFLGALALLLRALTGRRERVTLGAATAGLGLSLFRTGRYEEAAAAYREGLQVSPESVSLRYNMARLLAARGDGAEAERYFEEAARLAPGNARVRMSLAEHLLAAGAIGKAAIHFDDVARMAPGSAEALFGRGRILEATRRGAEARAVYESALRAPAILPDTHDGTSPLSRARARSIPSTGATRRFAA